MDPEYYKNLRWMLEHDISDVLDLTFTEEVDYFGRKELVELKPGGAMLKVQVVHFCTNWSRGCVSLIKIPPVLRVVEDLCGSPSRAYHLDLAGSYVESFI